MEWDADKLNAMLLHFGVSVNSISVTTGINKEQLYKLKAGYLTNRNYDGRLTAYLEAIRKAKVTELQTMIEYYENFKLC